MHPELPSSAACNMCARKTASQHSCNRACVTALVQQSVRTWGLGPPHPGDVSQSENHVGDAGLSLQAGRGGRRRGRVLAQGRGRHQRVLGNSSDFDFSQGQGRAVQACLGGLFMNTPGKQEESIPRTNRQAR